MIVSFDRAFDVNDRDGERIRKRLRARFLFWRVFAADKCLYFFTRRGMGVFDADFYIYRQFRARVRLCLRASVSRGSPRDYPTLNTAATIFHLRSISRFEGDELGGL